MNALFKRCKIKTPEGKPSGVSDFCRECACFDVISMTFRMNGAEL